MRTLPPEELAICKRLREARERILGLSQPEVARQLGITREKLLVYEYGRAPVRHEMALRFCRQLIISEEWLATGKHAACEKAGTEIHGITRGKAGSQRSLHPFFERQCVDLQAEQVFHVVPHNALYSDAWKTAYRDAYGALVRSYFHAPRIVFRDSDESAILANYFNVLFARWLALLSSEAAKHGVDPGMARRSFLRANFQTCQVIFRRFIGEPTPEIKGDDYNFLRALATDEAWPIGPLFDSSKVPSADRNSAHKFDEALAARRAAKKDAAAQAVKK